MKRDRRRTKEQITVVTVDNKLWQGQGKEGSGGETKVTGENERRQEQAGLRGKGVGRIGEENACAESQITEIAAGYRILGRGDIYREREEGKG